MKINGEKQHICNVENTDSLAPNTKYEYTKRKIVQDMEELWWYFESSNENLKTEKEITTILTDLRNRHSAILSQLEDLSNYDGYNSWREKESKELTDLVQKRISFIQNPRSCSNAKKLFCSIDGDCGFGCQFHRIVICLIISYATGRTLLLDTQNWSYSCDGKGIFEHIFQPISETCSLHRDYDISNSKIIEWPGTSDDEIVKFSFGGKHSRPKFLPPMVPKDLIDRIMRLHGNPVLWWLSQFVKFLWKFQPKTQSLLKESEKELGKTAITVGIHVRRNDKIIENESKYYPIAEYMKYAKEYFEKEEFKKKNKFISKQVFIASDDESVFDEIRKKYPEYKVLGDELRTRSASLMSRYDFESLKYLITDIHMLSQSDYIVCTLSSNVCKLAHSIQQQRFVDGSRRLYSLEDSWLNSGTLFTWRHVQQSIYSHEAVSPQQLSLNVGDYIFNITTSRDGFSFGTNMKNNRSGIYPTYKTIPVVQTYVFPTYPNATFHKLEYSSSSVKKNMSSNTYLGNLCQKQKYKCRSFDTNGNGYIENSELLQHFSSNDSIHGYLNQMDKDKDGKLSINECLTLIRTFGYQMTSL